MDAVSFIGAGNLAWQLAPALDNVGYPVREVLSQDPKNARALVKKLYHAVPKTNFDFSQSPSRIFLLAVPDDALEEVAKEIILPDQAILAHTSGSKPLAVLDYAAASSAGVFYPLQTFSKDRRIDFKAVPIFVESKDRATEKILMSMGKALSKQVVKLNSDKRTALHVAAVMACNFSNHLFHISKSILEREGLDFRFMQPLIKETVDKSFAIGPENAQTGPAVRRDIATLDKHFAYLKHDPEVAEIYRNLTQHIIDEYPEQ